MTWTTPFTAISGDTVTAAVFNAQVRDTMLEMEPAKAQNLGGYFVATGSKGLAERQFKSYLINRGESTTSTSYTDLTVKGPGVTVTTGTSAIVFLACRIEMSTSTNLGAASVTVSGASSVSASDDWACVLEGVDTASLHQNRRMSVHRFTGLTAGSNGFTMQYRVDGGTGNFQNREILVMPL